MSEQIHRTSDAPKREGLSWEERWNGRDRGLILNWEVGRERASTDPELASRAKRGELPPSVWKGGVAKPLKTKTKKYAPLSYLAEWQGLRGEDLSICIDDEIELVCSRTQVRVIYTSDQSKYSNA